MGARWANIGGQGGDSSQKSSRIYVKNGELAFHTSTGIRQALGGPLGSCWAHFGSMWALLGGLGGHLGGFGDACGRLLEP